MAYGLTSNQWMRVRIWLRKNAQILDSVKTLGDLSVHLRRRHSNSAGPAGLGRRYTAELVVEMMKLLRMRIPPRPAYTKAA